MSGDETIPAGATTERRLPWRRRHPRRARALLYGVALVVLGGGAAWASQRHAERAAAEEAERQEGLATCLNGTQGLYLTDPEGTLRFVRAEVLDRRPEPAIRRRAQLTVAACLDAAKRYEEAERAYAEVAAEWPESLPRGPLTVAWANMRVNAGRPAEALALMDVPQATAGWAPASQVDEVRARAERAMAAPSVPAADTPASETPAGEVR